MKKILFIVNDYHFLVSHRLPIALKLKQLGFDVHLASASYSKLDKNQRDSLKGLSCHHIAISRGGMNPFLEIKAFYSIWKVCRLLNPDLVHLVTIKPVLYGGIVAKTLGIPRVVAAISGLGSIFTAKKLKLKLVFPFIKLMYQFAFSCRKLKVIFQNQNDFQKLSSFVHLAPSQVKLIRGSGVNLENYPVSDEPAGGLVVTMAARLLKDKGIIEFVEAARILNHRKIQAKFWLVGELDPHNPTSITYEDMERWKEEGIVELLGHRKDIAEIFSKSHIIVLPSYREGLPKVLAEAAACARAVVTTDVPGCRDAIENGVTGILVEPKNAISLADGIQKLILEPLLRKKMAKEGRLLAERYFDIKKIVDDHIDVYRELGLFDN